MQSNQKWTPDVHFLEIFKKYGHLIKHTRDRKLFSFALGVYGDPGPEARIDEELGNALLDRLLVVRSNVKSIHRMLYELRIPADRGRHDGGADQGHLEEEVRESLVRRIENEDVCRA